MRSNDSIFKTVNMRTTADEPIADQAADPFVLKQRLFLRISVCKQRLTPNLSVSAVEIRVPKPKEYNR